MGDFLFVRRGDHVATLKTAADYAAEIGRAQNAYKEYGVAGRTDLQKGSSTYADSLRKAAKAGGIDLSGLGTTNNFGTDYTQYAGGSGGAYDPSKAGMVQKTNQDTGITQPVQPGQPQGPDINGIYDNYYQAALGKLRSARDTQLAGLAGQDDLVKQTAFASRDSNDVMAAQALQRVREQQANQGINGGDSVTAQLSNNTDRQNGANAINTNEGNQLKQLMAMRNAINNNASAEDLALLQQNQGDRASALLGQYNTDRQYGLQLGGLTGNFNGQRTLQGQQFDRGVFESDRTFDFNKGIDQRNFDYTVGRDKVADKQYQQEFDYRVKQDGLQNAVAWYNAKTSRQNSNNSGSPKPAKPASYKYKDDPDFQQDYLDATNDPGFASHFAQNPQSYMDKYGMDGYNALKKAIPKK